MELKINGERYEAEAANTLKAVLAEKGYDVDRTGIAVAVNDVVVPRQQWGVYQLGEGDRIEVIQAVQGG